MSQISALISTNNYCVFREKISVIRVKNNINTNVTNKRTNIH